MAGIGIPAPGLDSRWLFTAVVAVVAFERIFEVWLSRRNARRVQARGGVEYGGEHYRWMALLHTGFLFAAVAEVWLLRRPWIPWLATVAVVCIVSTMLLRYWAVVTLGDRWNTRVLCEPGAPRITGGPYRFLRHPNYLAVRVELVALPLLHCAWWTAMLFTLLNAWMLRVRIAVEDRALDECASASANIARAKEADAELESERLEGAAGV